MSYKRIVKKRGKSYGPYIYESYRDEAGNVKKRYLGKLDDKKELSVSKFLLFLISVILVLAMVGYTTDKIINNGEFSSTVFTSVEKIIYSTGDFVSGVTGFAISEENDSLESTDSGEVVLLDLEAENETDVVVMINDSVEVFENISELVNQTEVLDNVTEVLDNVTEETVGETVKEVDEVSISTLQYRAVIGRPVKWVKKIDSKDLGNVTVTLPKDAENITIHTKEEIQGVLNEVDDFEKVVIDTDREDLAKGTLISGYVSKDVDSSKGIFSRLQSWLSGFTIAGNVILEEEIESEIFETENETLVEVGDIVDVAEEEVAITYYTEAPQANETYLSNGKRVVVHAPDELNYTDILAYSVIYDVPGMEKISMNSSNLKLYWYASEEDAIRSGYLEGELPEVPEDVEEVEEVEEIEEIEEIVTPAENVTEEEIVTPAENVTEEEIEEIVTPIENVTEEEPTTPIENVTEEEPTTPIENVTEEETVTPIENVTEEEIVTPAENVIEEEPVTEEPITEEEPAVEEEPTIEVPITGEVVGVEGEPGIILKLFYWIGKQFGITGQAVLDNVSLEDDVLEVVSLEDDNLEQEVEDLLSVSKTPVPAGIRIEVDYVPYDFDDDGYVDYIEWIVPHLSAQTYEIISITKSNHLDSDKVFVSDIYQEVKSRDGNWSEVINPDEYVRVSFEKNLTNENDITLYARSNGSAGIEVYTKDSDNIVARFDNVAEDKKYQILLINLSEGSSYDSFDLKVKDSAVEFDYIVDPTLITDINMLIASDAMAEDKFGYAVSISGDYAIVGTSVATAYIFKKNATGQFEEVNILNESDVTDGDKFGNAVSISGDYAVVGAWLDDSVLDNAGVVYVYKKNATGQFEKVDKLVASDAESQGGLGYSVSIDGDYVAMGARYGNDWTGAAYIFKKNATGQFEEVNKLIASDLVSDDFFGESVSINGDYAIIGAVQKNTALGSGTGVAYIFKKNATGQFEEFNKLTASNAEVGDNFGHSVSINGDYAIIGARKEEYSEGSAYVFKKNATGQFEEIDKLVASNADTFDYFGQSVSISDGYVIVGAEEEDTGGDNAGAAYVFNLSEEVVVPTIPEDVFTFQINITSAPENFTFQADDADLDVWWNETNYTSHSGTGPISHEYLANGIYNISLNGSASRISYGEGTSNLLIDILSNLSVISGINSSYQMFLGADSITSFSESSWFDDISGNVTNMGSMFDSADFANPDVSNWNTSAVTDMSSVFYNADSVNPNVSNWNTASVTDMSGVFYNTDSANPDVSNWNTASVIYMNNVFDSTDFANPDVSNWDTSSVISMFSMFYGATSANPDVSNWNISSLSSGLFNGAEHAFDNSNLSTENYDNLLINWAAQSPGITSGVYLGAAGVSYCLGESARNDILVGTYSWVISDAGKNCSGIVGDPSDDKFVVWNSSGDVIAIFNDKGDAYFAGEVSENQGGLNAPNNSFVVQNNSGETIVYIDGLGNMFMRGSISVADSLSGTTTGDLEFRNSTNNLVSYFDALGNLKLKGGYSTKYIEL